MPGVEIQLGWQWQRTRPIASLLRALLGVCLITIVANPWVPFARGQGASPADLRHQWTALAKDLKRAGELYRDNKFDESAALVHKVAAKISSVPISDDATISKMKDKVQIGLDRALVVLKEQGMTFDEAPAVKAPGDRKGNGKSFVHDIVPIILAKCGGCHVQGTKGDVSLASFDALTTPTDSGLGLVVPGESGQSKFIEVIESGEMPKGKKKISPKELKTLREWIDGGAQFDGPNPSDTLDTLAAAK